MESKDVPALMDYDILGEHDMENENETVTFRSKAVRTLQLTHPNFYIRRARGKLDYDVGLLTLETPIDFRNKTYNHIRFVFLKI